MAGNNNKSLWKALAVFIGIILVVKCMVPRSNSGTTDVISTSNEMTIPNCSDTIFVGNDSINDMLNVKHGLQVVDCKFERVGYTDVGGYGINFFLKMRNVSEQVIGDESEMSLKLSYKVLDDKTDETIKSDYTYLSFNKLSPNEFIRLEPYVSWTYVSGRKYRVYLWIDDIPMQPIVVRMGY